MEPTRQEIIAYFESDVNGDGLQRGVLDERPDSQLKRMAELAGEGFTSWLQCQRNATPEPAAAVAAAEGAE